MLSFIAKLVLGATSLSPVLGALTISELERCEPWTSWVWWLAGAILLIVFCWLMLRYAAKRAQKSHVYIRSFERKDQEMLVFLFIYLLPFIRSANPTFASEPFTSLYVFGIILVAIAYADAFHFNPVMRLLFGYRFYSVRNREGVPNLLISKRDLRREGEEVQTVRLAWNVYLHIGEQDA